MKIVTWEKTVLDQSGFMGNKGERIKGCRIVGGGVLQPFFTPNPVYYDLPFNDLLSKIENRIYFINRPI